VSHQCGCGRLCRRHFDGGWFLFLFTLGLGHSKFRIAQTISVQIGYEVSRARVD
jgi:hypothetical protein